MIGGAIIRERYVEELKNANTIVESSPTILFRLRGDPSLPLIYVSRNVTFMAMSADTWRVERLWRSYPIFVAGRSPCPSS